VHISSPQGNVERGRISVRRAFSYNRIVITPTDRNMVQLHNRICFMKHIFGER
jgi:hypothetical protein